MSSPFSPVHSARKFSAVFGVTSLNSSSTTVPAASSPIRISRATLGFSAAVIWRLLIRISVGQYCRWGHCNTQREGNRTPLRSFLPSARTVASRPAALQESKREIEVAPPQYGCFYYLSRHRCLRLSKLLDVVRIFLRLYRNFCYRLSTADIWHAGGRVGIYSNTSPSGTMGAESNPRSSREMILSSASSSSGCCAS